VLLKIERYILFLFAISLMVTLFSCSTDSLNGNPTNSEPNVKLAKVDTAAVADAHRSNVFVPRLTPRELLENFNYCRDNAETDFTCKFYISKAICDYFGIDDFKSGDTYLDFEKIVGVVANDEKWTLLGEANDQKVLEEAQILGNQGKATVAINTNDPYGHVVFIVKGDLKAAHNWNGLLAPNCASFFMVNNLNPFVNKSMGYAFSSPEGVYLYSKK
jgi:hypothetical protein